MANFNEKELEIIGQYNMPGIYGAPDCIVPKQNRPITPKENMLRMLNGEMPLWVPNQTYDNNAIQPMVMPDAKARAFGGTDWFGIEWVYEPLTKAAMVKPGTRRLSDLANWKEELPFPDLSAIDWEGLVAQVRRELGIRPRLGGYSREDLERKAAGEAVFPHLFGTDRYGRDILVRVMVGTRVSMLVGLSAAALVLVIGALYGAVSGYCGGRVDAVMQRIVEVIYSIPEVLVILLLSTVLGDALLAYANTHTGLLARAVPLLGKNLISMFLSFGLLYWVTMSRIIRGQVLQLKGQEYVTAARALGASGARIIRRHLLPNCIGQIVVTTCLQIPSAIFLESFLSFLGVGVTTPLTSLGSLASEALEGLWSYPYRLIFPAVILSAMILSFNLVGDGLRDALDPRLKR